MVLPVFVYGSPVLRKVARDLTPDEPGLKKILDDMWETMYVTDGIGLAAPQVGLSVRLFVIDGTSSKKTTPPSMGSKKCLSIPGYSPRRVRNGYTRKAV